MATDRDGLATFNKIVGVESNIEVFLKCHLVLEFYMGEILRARAANSRVLNIDRLTFSQKLNLCEGLGFLDEHESAQLRTINRVRNRMAHGLGFEVTRDIADELAAALSPQATRIYGSLIESGPSNADWQHRFAWLFFAVIWSVGHRVLVTRYEQANALALEQLRIATAINDLVGDGKHLVRTGTQKTPDEIRKALGLPDYPDPHDALDLLTEATRGGTPEGRS